MLRVQTASATPSLPPARSQCGGDARSQTTGYSHFHSCHVIELVVTDEEVAVSSCLEGACTS